METLQSLDKSLFLLLNGLHNNFLDIVMFWISDKFIWIPFYLYLIYLIIKVYKKEGFVIVLVIIALIAACD